MSLLFESIKLENGEYHNLFYHEQRMNRAFKMVFGEEQWFNLEEFLAQLKRPTTGLYKCRLTYDDQTKDVEFIPYEAKPIHSLRIIYADAISYEHKYLDRNEINEIFSMRNGCDDVLIIKNEKVTDTSYANIVFKRSGKWYTPWATLLKGTMRQNLIEQNDIHEEDISVQEIKDYESFKLINAMVGFAGPEIDVSNIVY